VAAPTGVELRSEMALAICCSERQLLRRFGNVPAQDEVEAMRLAGREFGAHASEPVSGRPSCDGSP